MIVNDGNTGPSTSYALAPYHASTIDYAVEAELQILNPEQFGAGVIVRHQEQGSYRCGVVSLNSDSAIITATDPAFSIEASRPFSTGGKYHLYRVEARGNTVKLSIDGAQYVQLTDNKYLDGVEVGLWSLHDEMSVRSFKVIAL